MPETVATRLRSVPSSLRTRIVAWFVGVLGLATAASIVATNVVLEIRLDQRIGSELVQEAAELRRLASGNDPETGTPFGPNVRRIFAVFLDRNVPARNEAFVTFVDGEVFERSRAVLPYRLDQDERLVARWSDVTVSDRGRVRTPAGRVEYLAVPVNTDGRSAGVFVAAIFRDRVDDDVQSATLAVGSVGLAVLLVGSLLAWRLADRVVRPVAELTSTARAISETDLGRRIPAGGRDEVAQLATTFNEMLDRLERTFATQRSFLDDAAHELRTPLTILRGHLELIEDDPERRAETLALVLDELDRMSRMVEDLLLLSRREQPDFLDLAPVDVALLTDELEGKIGALAHDALEVESRGRGVIVGDRQRLTQAVVELARNAVRYGRDGARVRLGGRRERRGVLLDSRLRPRRRARRPRPHLRALPAWPAGTGRRRRGARARDREGDRRGPSRPRRARQRARPRLDVPDRRARRPAGSAAGGDVTRILIAEDEARIASFVEKGLRANGFATDVVGDGESALRLARTGRYDLLILDLGLPELEGLDVLQRLRETGATIPVVILTARDSVRDTVAGLEGGADDYLTKPFRFEELLARVRVRLRGEPAAEATVLRAGDLSLDLRTRQAIVDGRAVDLSAREFAMAEVFFRHPGQVLSREQLLSHVWGYDFDPGSNVVDVYVGYLRRKLGKERITAVRGMGYRLEKGDE